MSYITVEVSIEHGQIVAKEPEKVPQNATGLLTILAAPNGPSGQTTPARKKVELPLIRGDGKHIINPTSKELDDSLWGDQAG